MPIIITDYNPDWSATFERLRERVWPAIRDVAQAIEHVGSTSVVGLPAKPIIDMTIVVADDNRMRQVIARLASIGYRHRGDLGVVGREAFAAPADLPSHHLYACVQGCLALRNHLSLRDRLRRDPAAATAYGRLKQELATRCGDDIDAYIEGKTAFILSLLQEADFAGDEMETIRSINAGPSKAT